MKRDASRAAPEGESRIAMGSRDGQREETAAVAQTRACPEPLRWRENAKKGIVKAVTEEEMTRFSDRQMETLRKRRE